eukprot:1679981-Alexandrium_andersonii.AAC.1
MPSDRTPLEMRTVMHTTMQRIIVAAMLTMVMVMVLVNAVLRHAKAVTLATTTTTMLEIVLIKM